MLRLSRKGQILRYFQIEGVHKCCLDLFSVPEPQRSDSASLKYNPRVWIFIKYCQEILMKMVLGPYTDYPGFTQRNHSLMIICPKYINLRISPEKVKSWSKGVSLNNCTRSIWSALTMEHYLLFLHARIYKAYEECHHFPAHSANVFTLMLPSETMELLSEVFLSGWVSTLSSRTSRWKTVEWMSEKDLVNTDPGGMWGMFF